ADAIPAPAPPDPVPSSRALTRWLTLGVVVLICALAAVGAWLALAPSRGPEGRAAAVAELVWRANELWQNRQRSRPTFLEVRDLLERALALDPDNVEANARLGAILSAAIENGFSNDRTIDLAAADRALQRALQADPSHYSALHGRCEWLRAKSLFEE